MKKTLVLLACLLALALGASAQENLNFADLPLVSSPAPMPKLTVMASSTGPTSSMWTHTNGPAPALATNSALSERT